MNLRASGLVAVAVAGALAAASPASARPWHHHGGSDFGAGIVGFAAGALIGGALAASRPYYGPPAYAAPRVYAQPEVYAEGPGGAEAYCASRFRSYDPASGSYMGYDGMRHSCP